MHPIARQLLLCVLASSLAACQTTVVSFPNVALSSADAQLKISGLLAKPEGPGPFPAVVILHSCGGVRRHVSVDWPEFLKGLGYVTLTVDSFGSRGLGPCGNTLHPAGPGRKTQAYHEITRDAYGAFDYLAAQPFVDKDRIAVMGFSLGANVINSYLIHEFGSLGDGWRPFKAAVGVYGRCHDLAGFSREHRPQAPPLMQIAGELDKLHVYSCLGLPPSIEVHVIPGAHHSWDDLEASHRINPYGDYAQYDRRATERSRELVKSFLARHLGK